MNLTWIPDNYNTSRELDKSSEHNLTWFSAGVCFWNHAQVRNTVLHRCSSGLSEWLQMCTLVPLDSLCLEKKADPSAMQWHVGCPSVQTGSLLPQGPPRISSPSFTITTPTFIPFVNVSSSSVAYNTRFQIKQKYLTIFKCSIMYICWHLRQDYHFRHVDTNH